jgi:DNA-3-methyladenine glycosylase
MYLMQQEEINTSAKTWEKLPDSFYQRGNVVAVTKELIGKILVTTFSGNLTAGRIVEAEAYDGPVDKASHSYNNRRTKRTEVMYAAGGVAYIYLCYGIHQMFNIVTNVTNVPNAVLIRAVEPLAGIDVMLQRCNKTELNKHVTRGPGNVAKALGLHTSQTGTSLQSDELYIADDKYCYPENEIIATPRIGVAYAAEHALLPYRFIVKGNQYVSGNKVNNVNRHQ